MDYEVTVKVTDGEKTIEIPWDDIKDDYIDFILEKASPEDQLVLSLAFRMVTSRIRCVFFDRYKKYLIQ